MICDQDGNPITGNAQPIPESVITYKCKFKKHWARGKANCPVCQLGTLMLERDKANALARESLTRVLKLEKAALAVLEARGKQGPRELAGALDGLAESLRLRPVHASEIKRGIITQTNEQNEV